MVRYAMIPVATGKTRPSRAENILHRKDGEQCCGATRCATFPAFAHELDDTIPLECTFAPPDPLERDLLHVAVLPRRQRGCPRQQAMTGETNTFISPCTDQDWERAVQQLRSVLRVVQVQETNGGAGVRLHRASGYPNVPLSGLLLMPDDFRADRPEDYRAGFPGHPHRGIETVTFIPQRGRR